MQPKVISFSSGKGGVGKTSVVANLGYVYSQSGKRTLLVDGDWSLGKLGMTLGVSPQWTVESVLSGQISIQDAIHRVNDHLDILASPSGVIGFEELSVEQRTQLYYELEELAVPYDKMLLDHSSGLGHNVLQFAAASHQHVVITTSEPTSYTDAYAIMKVLSRQFGVKEFLLLVTFSQNRQETHQIIERFMNITRENLNVRVQLMDIFPWEPRLAECIRKRKLFVEEYPGFDWAKRMVRVCRTLETLEVQPQHGLRFCYGNDISTMIAR